MKVVFRLALLAVLAGLGWWLWGVCFPSPQKVVLKRMAALAETVSFEAGSSSVSRALKAANLIDFFAVDAEISVDTPELGTHALSGRDEIREAGNGGFATLTSLKVSFLDTTVHVGPDQQTADADCTLRVFVGAEKDFGVQEMHFQWKKMDGAWQITRAETVRTLK